MKYIQGGTKMKLASKSLGAQYMKGEIAEEVYDKALERVHKEINIIINDYFTTHHST
jgi:hypothetical protein